MCGRFSLTTPVDGIRALFGFSQIPNLPARYNIAPTQAVLAVRRDEGGRSAFMARWGLIPGWSKDPGIGAKLINARSETVQEKPSFRSAFQRRRCLIPANSFYEWKTMGGARQPFRIAFDDGELFAFAGLWERWQGGDGSDVETCSIVTTDASPALVDLHHRMPVILDAEKFETWLAGSPGDAAALTVPYSGSRRLIHHPVSRRLNDVRNDDADLLCPIELLEEPPPPKKSDDQLTLF